MADFLSSDSLPCDLTRLLPLFVQQGIVDRESFLGLLRMDWRSYVYSWVRCGLLTELDFAFLKEGLEKAVTVNDLSN